jgi:hypothetical protein
VRIAKISWPAEFLIRLLETLLGCANAWSNGSGGRDKSFRALHPGQTVGFFELSTPTEFPEQFAEGFS